jgi:hypothetical protein
MRVAGCKKCKVSKYGIGTVPTMIFPGTYFENPFLVVICKEFRNGCRRAIWLYQLISLAVGGLDMPILNRACNFL